MFRHAQWILLAFGFLSAGVALLVPTNLNAALLLASALPMSAVILVLAILARAARDPLRHSHWKVLYIRHICSRKRSIEFEDLFVLNFLSGASFRCILS
jgi:hypothetical protein